MRRRVRSLGVLVFLSWSAWLSGAQPANRPLEDAIAREAELASALRGAIEKFDTVAASLGKINAAKAEKDEVLAGRLMDQLLTEHPALFLAVEKVQDKDGLYVAEATRVREALEAALAELVKDSVASCFDPEHHTFRQTKACKDRLTKDCDRYGSSGGGRLHVTIVGDSFELSDHEVSSGVEAATIAKGYAPTPPLPSSITAFMEAVLNRSFSFCQAAGLAGQFFEPKEITNYPLNPPPARPFWLPSAPEEFRSECFTFDVFDAYSNYLYLQSRYPKSFALKLWGDEPKKRAEGCAKAVRDACMHTYQIGGEIILAYLTKGCEVREVTEQDVDNDIRDFAILGVTHAEQLKHAQLKRTIGLCRDAATAGYIWAYIEPVTAACKKPSAPTAKTRGNGKRPQ